ncbi:MAG: class I SAM-dependent methyltransferase [Ginsengibacter sp.]
MPDDNFISIPFRYDNLDRYLIRTGILNALRNSLPLFKGRLLDIGCGKMPYKEFILANSSVEKYIGLDIENALEYDKLIRPDFTWDGIKMPFENESFETAFGTEVLEHCPNPEIILKEVNRILKSGGVFFFTVPFLWPLHEVPHDEYRYTPFSLKRILGETGFENIEIRATGGWHASMAQMMGLWVRRAPLGKNKRKLFSALLKPVMKYLIKKDRTSEVNFSESQMITGLYGIAYKK